MLLIHRHAMRNSVDSWSNDELKQIGLASKLLKVWNNQHQAHFLRNWKGQIVLGCILFPVSAGMAWRCKQTKIARLLFWRDFIEAIPLQKLFFQRSTQPLILAWNALIFPEISKTENSQKRPKRGRLWCVGKPYSFIRFDCSVLICTFLSWASHMHLIRHQVSNEHCVLREKGNKSSVASNSVRTGLIHEGSLANYCVHFSSSFSVCLIQAWLKKDRFLSILLRNIYIPLALQSFRAFS